jgi:hypothetical protein
MTLGTPSNFVIVFQTEGNVPAMILGMKDFF